MTSGGGTRRELSLLALLLAAWGALLGFRLFLEPFVGIANNADFARLLCQVDIRYPEHLTWPEKYFVWINKTFEFGPPDPGCGNYDVSTMVPLKAALAIHHFFRPDARTIDLRWMGLVNSILMVAAIGLVLAATRRWRSSLRVILLCLLTLVFADIGYAVYLNSFYPEPTSLQFFLMTAGLFLILLLPGNTGIRASAGRILWRSFVIVLFILSYGMFALSKPQNYMLSFCSVLLVAPLLLRRTWLERALLVLGTAAVILCSLIPFTRTDPVFRRMQIFDIVFFDITPNSPDPKVELRDLGLPEEYTEHVGKAAWGPGTPMGHPDFIANIDRITYPVLAKFYLTHPRALWDDLSRAATIVFDVRVAGWYGHYAPESGKPERSQSTAFSAWSDLRETLFPRSLWFLITFGVLNLVLIGVKWRRFDRDPLDRGVTVLHGWILVILAASFGITALAEGSMDPKHMFLVNVAFDSCLVVLAMYGLGLLAGRSSVSQKNPESERAAGQTTEPSPSATT